MATDYGLDDPSSGSLVQYLATNYKNDSIVSVDMDTIETILTTVGPGAHPASCKMGTGSFPGVKCGRGVLLTTHPLLVPLSWKSRAIPLPTFWARAG